MTLNTPQLSETVRTILAAGQDTAEDIMARVAARWDLSAPLPVPRPGWLRCPVCRAPDVIPKEWRTIRIREPAGHRFPFRCDVSFKCLDCSAVWVHGLPFDDVSGRRLAGGDGPRVVHWREGVGLLRAWAFGHDVSA